MVIRKYFLLDATKAKKIHDMESDMNAEIDENVEISEESGDKTTFSNIGEQESLLESTCESKDEDYDTFNLNISLAIVDSETDEVDEEFLEALTEIEGKKSFPCPNCTKVCKSKGGLTKHKNSKHQEADTESGNTDNENCLLFESLAGIVELKKANLIAEDLYGSEINTAIKSASCSEAFFAVVLPLYNKFSRKKNQDKLLEEFYGFFRNASKYLNCPDSKAARLVKSSILVYCGFFVAQHLLMSMNVSGFRFPHKHSSLVFRGFMAFLRQVFCRNTSRDQNFSFPCYIDANEVRSMNFSISKI